MVFIKSGNLSSKFVNSYNAMKKVSILLIGLCFFLSGLAQSPSTCFEIESILVDACGSPEGENEMVIFHTGPNPLNVSDLTVTWPNNPWLGVCQNGTTATKVAQLNATILNCGWLLEPTAGVLPPNQRVILITSTNFDTGANSFANLSDTLYVIFQCAGNTAGHFANATGSGNRTLTMSFSNPPGCSDAVTYNCQQLVDINGFTGTGGTTADRDGSTVEFSWNGTPTYTNDGCNAPFIPQTVDAGFGPWVPVCMGDTIPLNGSLTGTFSDFFWSGGGGVILQPDSINAFYVIGGGDIGTIYIYLTAMDCNDTIRDSISMTLLPSSVVSFDTIGPLGICGGDSILLNAVGTGPFTWSDGTFGPASIYASTPGTYWVTVNSGCGVDTAYIDVVSEILPSGMINEGVDSTICPGTTLNLNASGNGLFVWSTGDTASTINISLPGNYYLLTINSCGTDTSYFTLQIDTVNASFTADPVSGSLPLTVNFTNTSTFATTYLWNFGDGNTSTEINPIHDFNTPGVFNTLLIAYNDAGCSDTAVIQITVDSCNYTMSIPNVFSPNNDGVNDLYFVQGECVESIEVIIYNRWGWEVIKWTDLSFMWNAETSTGSAASDGTYFYVVNVKDVLGTEYRYSGFLTLIR